MLLAQLLRTLCVPGDKTRAKPITLHFALVIGVLLYAFIGGVIFHALESGEHMRVQLTDEANKRECVRLILLDTSEAALTALSANSTAYKIVECWRQEDDMRTEWSYVTATLYGFGIVTTLGYNRINAITTAGRMFCIVYGICGIPLAMIILANVGQYLNQFACNLRKRFEQRRERRRRSKGLIEDEDDENVELTSLMVLVVFLVYVGLGALLLPLLNGEFDFLNGLYFNFLCLTAIDFGALVPKRVAFLPITLTYVCIGLAITTLAIDVGSDYMKKLHYLGKKMKNAATTKIWFGGKSMKVSELLHAVGKKLGVDPQVIDNMDLNNVVERVIAIQEGRPPPPDPEEIAEVEPLLDKGRDSPKFIDDEPPPLPANSPPASPPSHFVDFPTIIHEPAVHRRLDVEESLAVEIAFDEPEEKSPPESPLSLYPMEELEQYPLVIECPAQAVPDISHNPTVLLHTDQIRILIDPDDGTPETDSSYDFNRRASVLSAPDLFSEFRSAPQSSMTSPLDEEAEQSESSEAFVPKRFKEKKEMYGRDPRKLFETYQEEWDRIERLNARRLGGRRKSLLSFQ